MIYSVPVMLVWAITVYRVVYGVTTEVYNNN